jgi:hypothetical protein
MGAEGGNNMSLWERRPRCLPDLLSGLLSGHRQIDSGYHSTGQDVMYFACRSVIGAQLDEFIGSRDEVFNRMSASFVLIPHSKTLLKINLTQQE